MWCICVPPLTDYRGSVNGPGRMSQVAGAPRWLLVAAIALAVSLGGALGIVRATNSHLDDVPRVVMMSNVLSPPTDGVENYLLVGSDSRASADPTSSDYGAIGSEQENPGMRSDTLILVSRNTATGAVSTMSIPRDLWVRMGDTSRYAKINAAYQQGADVLVRTVQRALNIPVHHYVDVNFGGFKRIVDAIGGVHICVKHASRDNATGFYIGRKACKLQNGAQALAYARSRHFEEKIDGRWREDGTGDVGRGARQRAFISTLAKEAATYLARHPFKSSQVLDAFSSAVSIDENLDLLDLAKKLRPLGDGSSRSFALPVSSSMQNDNFIFTLANDARPVLAFFAGVGPMPDLTAD
jgi:LCP family protein required for cell wall assembly